MQDFKKIILSIAIFLLLFIVIIWGLIASYCEFEVTKTNDKNARNELAGDIDYLILGASQGMTAFNTQILDEELDCNSYNLSATNATWNGRKYLLEEEIDRNPIETIVIDVSFDNMYRDSFSLEGDLYLYPRLSSLSSKIDYIVNCCDSSEYDMLLSESVQRGALSLARYIKCVMSSVGSENLLRQAYISSSEVLRGMKGFLPRETNDVSLDFAECQNLYNSESINLEWNDENVNIFSEIVRECQSKGIRTVVVVTPIADSAIWELDGWDEFYKKLSEICAENSCELFDFNLLKERYSIYNDVDSFADIEHLSEKGAKAFTHVFCEVFSNEKIGSDLFYESYNEMILDSPYYKYVKENK